MINNFLDKYIFTGGFKYVHNNFFLMGIPFLMIPVNLLVSFAKKQDKVFDKEVYYSFKESMKETVSTQLGVDFKLEGDKGLLLVEELFTAFGWGLVKQVDIDSKKKRAVLIVNNSPLAQKMGGIAKRPVDHFLRGIFAGLFSVFFEEEVECVETKCIALNHNMCEFVIKKKEEFDFSKELTRTQLDLDK